MRTYFAFRGCVLFVLALAAAGAALVAWPLPFVLFYPSLLAV